MADTESTIRVSAVRIPKTRDSYGSCLELATSMRDDGLRHPITVWGDGVLVSGGRRLRAALMLGEKRISAVYVHTIEDAAKRLMIDAQDPYLSLPWKWSEACRLWEVVRTLEAPAAAHRLNEARRRGVALRRLTQSGKRAPGRSRNSTEDYFLTVMAQPYGVSSVTASRAEAVYRAAYVTSDVPDAKRELAQEIMADIDKGKSVWAGYQRLMDFGRTAPVVVRPRPVVITEPAPAAQQLAAWARAMPQLEGLTSGLIELGPPNTALTWDQVGPVHTQLKAIRRGIEQIINGMKETSK